MILRPSVVRPCRPDERPQARCTKPPFGLVNHQQRDVRFERRMQSLCPSDFRFEHQQTETIGHAIWNEVWPPGGKRGIAESGNCFTARWKICLVRPAGFDLPLTPSELGCGRCRFVSWLAWEK